MAADTKQMAQGIGFELFEAIEIFSNNSKEMCKG
jgi:hypothetical protein